MRPRSRPSALLKRLEQDFGSARVGFVLAVCAVLSLEIVFQPDLFDLWSVAEVARAWATELLELIAVAVTYMAVVSAVRGKWPDGPLQDAMLIGAIALTSLAVAALLEWGSAGQGAVDLAAIPGEALRWGVIASFLVGIDVLQRRARRAQADARATDMARQQLAGHESTLQLQLLQAQIEPHFLFNTLAIARHLGRTQPADGATMIDHLQRYLQAALPQFRHARASLGDELGLVDAYLRLLQLRMGARLRFTIDAPAAVRALPFPSMTVLTLVENAIKHGIEPTEHGGRVAVRALSAHGRLVVTVTDDGAGLNQPGCGGTGVGLVNVQRQLKASYGSSASLELLAGEDGKTVARMSVRLPRAGARDAEPQEA